MKSCVCWGLEPRGGSVKGFSALEKETVFLFFFSFFATVYENISGTATFPPASLLQIILKNLKPIKKLKNNKYNCSCLYLPFVNILPHLLYLSYTQTCTRAPRSFESKLEAAYGALPLNSSAFIS